MPNLLPPAKLLFVVLNLGLLSAIVTSWAWVIYKLATQQRLLPEGQPILVPWGGKVVLMIVFTYIGLQVLVPSLYMGSLRAIVPLDDVRLLTFLSAHVKRSLGASQQIVVTILISLPFLAVSLAILAQWGHATPADFIHDRRKFPSDIVRGMVAWPILAPIVFGINFLATRVWTDPDRHPIQAWAADNPDAISWATIFFAAVVVAPLTEEFLFRGVLLGWLTRVALGVNKPDVSDQDVWITPRPSAGSAGIRLFLANLVVSIVFAALHAQVWPSPIPLFLLALSLGYLYQRTGSLIAPIVLHMTFNGISTTILYVASLSGGLEALKQEIKAAPPVAPQVAISVDKGSIKHDRLVIFPQDCE